MRESEMKFVTYEITCRAKQAIPERILVGLRRFYQANIEGVNISFYAPVHRERDLEEAAVEEWYKMQYWVENRYGEKGFLLDFVDVKRADFFRIPILSREETD